MHSVHGGGAYLGGALVGVDDLYVDRLTGLVHVTVPRCFNVDFGNGNVGTEEVDVALCDLVAGREWEEAHPMGMITCLTCLSLVLSAARYYVIGTSTGVW